MSDSEQKLQSEHNCVIQILSKCAVLHNDFIVCNPEKAIQINAVAQVEHLSVLTSVAALTFAPLFSNISDTCLASALSLAAKCNGASRFCIK